VSSPSTEPTADTERGHLTVRACQRGITAILKSLTLTAWGTKDFYVEDPDGYIVCFGGRLGKDHLRTGDYLYTAPNNKHAVKSDGGCVLLVVVPEAVEILAHTKRASHEGA
jgi:hypothetical protein